MKTFATILAGVALALTGASASAETLAERGEKRLAEMLEGRTAGTPVSCISTPRSNKLDVIEEVGLVYEAGDTIYVSRPSDPKSLDRDDVLVIERFGSQLCKQDVVRTMDRYQGFINGAVFLGDFVPYKKNG
ncbi:MAG: hypothetical protein B7Z08_05295 [Sphingomonadales bacterium 32-68-7]|nr:MAG: hypothetical protein B7Z33_00870 [Sphingomonadales bacterium 12-68-11]OYX09416.1 MAG: hypothetical protein B7Z08_05295 [Sphingomonadales bacterium 32-68-7]